MKLQGIILPTSLAVSTPTIVPAGALAAIFRLLSVIVIDLFRCEQECHRNHPGAHSAEIAKWRSVNDKCVYCYISEIAISQA